MMSADEGRNIKIEKPCVLLVEGPVDDLWFFKALAKHLELQDVIQIIAMYGKTELRSRLRAISLASKQNEETEIVSLGIVRDADKDPKAAFQSICDALTYINFPVPKYPLKPTDDRPQVTVMILPDDHTNGMIEDLCLRSVESELAMICVKQYFECLRQQRLPFPRIISKAKVQVYLASKPESGKRLGEAAEAGYWLWKHKAFEQVKEFLRQIVVFHV